MPHSVKIAYIWGKGLGVLADKVFKKGAVVIHFKADILPCSQASPEAVQVSARDCLDTFWLAPEPEKTSTISLAVSGTKIK